MTGGSLAFAGNPEPFLIGTNTTGANASASRGIYSAVLNAADGTIADLKLAAEVPTPSFLAHHPTHDVIYAVVGAAEFNGESGGGIVAFSRDASTMEWKPLSNQAVGGQNPCHLALDPTGQIVITANYGDGTVSVFPVRADGSLGPRSQLIQHTGSGPNESRQKGPHPHGITFSPDSRLVFVPDLGIDQIKIYDVDASGARLTPAQPDAVDLPSGAGPRHFVFSPDGKHAYSINELDSTITVFAWDSAKAVLAALASVSTLPTDWTGKNSTAEIAVHPSGQFVVGSNRGHDSLAVFKRDTTTGMLSPLSVVACGGEKPRSFSFSPDGHWVVVANQSSNTLTTFAFDAATGALTPTGHSADVGMPVCVLFEE